VRERLKAERNFATAEVVGKVAAEAGKTAAQVALNWVLTRDGVTAPILGARTLEQLEDNLGATEWSLDADQERVLAEVSAIERGYPYDFIDMVSGR
jgi:aryl-alcohol dehydrogenase-like predicted oxidoreductase